MYFTGTEVTFTFDEILKHSRLSHKQKPLIFRVFISRNPCLVATLISYLAQRLPVTDNPDLFIKTVNQNYFAIWDLNTLLSCIQHKGISVFYDISQKITYTFYDSCRQKVQCPCSPKSKKMYFTDTEVPFTLDEILKHSRLSRKQKPLIFRVFTSRDLCIKTPCN